MTVIERAAGEPPGGAGLGLDRHLLSDVTGVDAARIPVVSGNRPSAAWGLVREFLLDATRTVPGVEFIESVTVTGVRVDDSTGPVVLESTAGAFAADVVVGADGVYSVTRRFVAPEQPTASYAGYLLWRGLVCEADVPGGLNGRGTDLEIHRAPGAQLVIYAVPGSDGRTDSGHRRVSCAWYDGSRTDLLRDTGCIKDGAVVATLRNDQIPDALVSELRDYARRYWPSPWDRCVSWAVTHGRLFGAPVAEYLPPRLARDRVALVGDAAHVASPMTGAGFQNALLDVAALAASLRGADPASLPDGLARYERERLALARQLVSAGMSWGRAYLSSM